ncbi:2-oxo acid dehydrogenase subunit E2 [Candidatus Woesearchaeota archaeon]|nr:2-oxo acid dehydrogenase subunit E2 [Candidatus Woesearchaeota archaeon]
MVYEFRFPDVGEGITEAELIKWLVKERDKVKEHQDIAQIETDKAVAEIPSPATGKVLKLYFKEGATIKVGDIIITIDDGKKEVTTNLKELHKKSVAVVGELEEAKEVTKVTVIVPKKVSEGILATPKIRNLANKLNVDINKIQGTGPEERILEEDILNAVKGVPQIKKEIPKAITVKKKYDMWGYLERIPLKGIRKTIAENMIKSLQTTAQVTSMDDIDITNLWNKREKEKLNAEKKGIKLTLLPSIIKAVVEGLKKHPYLNASLQEDEIILKKYYNIGIAVATEDGLLVPVIKGADQKDLYSLAKEIQDLSEKAKNRKLDLMDMKGSSLTITNYGSINGTYGTPIINPGESAILGLGRTFDRVVLINNKPENRKILPVSLTFDHQVLDGAEAAQFLKDIKGILENYK